MLLFCFRVLSVAICRSVAVSGCVFVPDALSLGYGHGKIVAQDAEHHYNNNIKQSV